MKNLSTLILTLALTSMVFTTCGDGCAHCGWISSAATCTKSAGMTMTVAGALTALTDSDTCVAYERTGAAADALTCIACRESTIKGDNSGCDTLTTANTITNCHIYGAVGTCQYCKNGALLDSNTCVKPTDTTAIPANCLSAKLVAKTGTTTGEKVAACMSCGTGFVLDVAAADGSIPCKAQAASPTGCTGSEAAAACTGCRYLDGFFGTAATAADAQTCTESAASPKHQFLVATKTTTTNAVWPTTGTTTSTTTSTTTGTTTSTTTGTTTGTTTSTNTSTNTSTSGLNPKIGFAIAAIFSYIAF